MRNNFGSNSFALLLQGSCACALRGEAALPGHVTWVAENTSVLADC